MVIKNEIICDRLPRCSVCSVHIVNEFSTEPIEDQYHSAIFHRIVVF